jgi:hypothetical protein
MDLVHEDPNIEKKYIKRLMKHRKMESMISYMCSWGENGLGKR